MIRRSVFLDVGFGGRKRGKVPDIGERNELKIKRRVGKEKKDMRGMRGGGQGQERVRERKR
jgi:hypothetical protein